MTFCLSCDVSSLSSDPVHVFLWWCHSPHLRRAPVTSRMDCSEAFLRESVTLVSLHILQVLRTPLSLHSPWIWPYLFHFTLFFISLSIIRGNVYLCWWCARCVLRPLFMLDHFFSATAPWCTIILCTIILAICSGGNWGTPELSGCSRLYN